MHKCIVTWCKLIKTKAYIRDERRQKNFSLPREVDEVGHENFLVHFGIFWFTTK